MNGLAMFIEPDLAATYEDWPDYRDGHPFGQPYGLTHPESAGVGFTNNTRSGVGATATAGEMAYWIQASTSVILPEIGR